MQRRVKGWNELSSGQCKLDSNPDQISTSFLLQCSKPLPALKTKLALDNLAPRRELASVERRSRLVRNFAIAGFILAEVYMVLSVSAPRLKGVEIPAAALTARLLASSLLFGPFGLAMGTGIGLLADGLRRSVLKSRQNKKG